jgi:hypothetical protein
VAAPPRRARDLTLPLHLSQSFFDYRFSSIDIDYSSFSREQKPARTIVFNLRARLAVAGEASFATDGSWRDIN